MAVPSLKYVRIIVGHNHIYEVDKVTEEEKGDYWWTKPELRQMRNDYKEEIMMEGIRQLVKTRMEQEEDDPTIIEERVDEIMQQPPMNIAAFLESKPGSNKKAMAKKKNDIIDSTKKKAANKTKERTKSNSPKKKKKRKDDDSSSSSSSSSDSDSSSSSSSSDDSEDETTTTKQSKRATKTKESPKPKSPKKKLKQLKSNNDESWLEGMMDKTTSLDSKLNEEKSNSVQVTSEKDETTVPTESSSSSGDASISDSEEEDQPKRRPSGMKNTNTSDITPVSPRASPRASESQNASISSRPPMSPKSPTKPPPASTSPETAPFSPSKRYSPTKKTPKLTPSPRSPSKLALPFSSELNDDETNVISADDSDDEDDDSECPICLGLVDSSQQRKVRLLKEQLCKSCRNQHCADTTSKRPSNAKSKSGTTDGSSEKKKKSNGRLDLYGKNYAPREMGPKRHERANRSPIRVPRSPKRSSKSSGSSPKKTDKKSSSRRSRSKSPRPETQQTINDVEMKSPGSQRLRSKASKSKTKSSRYANLSPRVSPRVARSRISSPRNSSTSPDPLSRFVEEKKDLGLRTRSRSPTSNRAGGDHSPEKKPLRSGKRGGKSRPKDSVDLTSELKMALPDKSPTQTQSPGGTKKRVVRRSNSMPKNLDNESETESMDASISSTMTASGTAKKKVRRRPRLDSTGKKVRRRSHSLQPKDLTSTDTPESPKKKKSARRGRPSTTQSKKENRGDPPGSSLSTPSVKIDKDKIKERLAIRRRSLQHQQRTKMAGHTSALSPGKYSSGNASTGLSSFLTDSKLSRSKRNRASDDDTIQTAPI